MCPRSASLALLAFLAVVPAAPLRAQPCACDCDGDAVVGIGELTLGVNIALERRPLSDCFAADANRDDRVVIAELIAAVRAALDGCPSVAARRALEEARSRFEQLGAHSYDYNYKRFCFCFDPSDVDIEVRNDEIVSIRDAFSGTEVVAQDPNAYLTIPELFDFIDDALTFADVIDVRYDPETGIPLSISVDFQRQAVDDELGIQVSDLRVVVDDGCRSDADCDLPISECVEPGGFVGCGICQHLEGECATDTDCGGNLICDFSSPSACPCDGPVLVCQEGCGQSGDCDEGEICAADRHCRPQPCTGGDCPAHFDCDPGPSTCVRRACTDDTDCEAVGFCVGSLCYDELGNCEALPP